jgi:hypothetical protein
MTQGKEPREERSVQSEDNKKAGTGHLPNPGLSTWKTWQLSLADHQLLADMDHIIREVIPVFKVLNRHAVLLGNAV